MRLECKATEGFQGTQNLETTKRSRQETPDSMGIVLFVLV